MPNVKHRCSESLFRNGHHQKFTQIHLLSINLDIIKASYPRNLKSNKRKINEFAY